jgi:hypothetical protein
MTYRARTAQEAAQACLPALLDIIERGKDTALEQALVEGLGAQPAITVPLAHHRFSWVRRTVARHSEMTSQLITELLAASGDQTGTVEALAANLSVRPATLRQLARDPDEYHRSVAAVHPNCPGSALRQLASNKSSLIRIYVADNPSCPEQVLQKLLRDPDRRVQLVASRNPALPRYQLAMWQLTNQGPPGR